MPAIKKLQKINNKCGGPIYRLIGLNDSVLTSFESLKGIKNMSIVFVSGRSIGGTSYKVKIGSGGKILNIVSWSMHNFENIIESYANFHFIDTRKCSWEEELPVEVAILHNTLAII